MTLWLFVVLALLALPWVLMGVFSRRVDPGTDDRDEVALNRDLYREKTRELRQQLERGEISDQECRELELEYQRQLLADSGDLAGTTGGGVRAGGRWLLVLVAVAIPLLAFYTYQQIGAAGDIAIREQLEQRAHLMRQARESGDESDARAAERAEDRLLATLEREAGRRPDEPVYPVMLARIHQDRGEFESSLAYYRRAISLLPEDGELQAEYAQSLFFAAGNQVTPEVVAHAERALALAPDNDTALGLMGIAAYQQGRFQEAVDYWSRALMKLSPQASAAGALRAGIASARQQLEGEGREARRDEGGRDEEGQAAISVRVSLADDLEAPSDARVFVYARAWQGSPMPLAIRRLRVADLPAEVVLDETMAMGGGADLNSVSALELVARVSLSGDATAASGDMEGRLGPVTLGDADGPLALEVDRELP